MALTKNEQPATISLAGNDMWVDYSTDKFAEDFIGINYSVNALIDAVWTLLGSKTRYEPDAAHKVQRDIHDLLEWNPEKEFSWPEKVTEIITKRNDLRRQYEIEVEEVYGNPLAIDDDDTISSIYALPGKISDLQLGLLNGESETWWSDQLTAKRFLTNAPRQKITDAWSSERLYFLIDATPSGPTISLNVKINYTDDTSTSFIRETASTVAQYDIYEIITSFSTLGLYLHDTSKVVESYEIWLTDDASAVLTEVFTYVLDHIRKSDTRYFIFANAHKMPEGIRFTGGAKNLVSNAFQESQRTLPKGHTVDKPSNIKSNTSESLVIETSSEWLTVDQMNWFRELPLSTEVYEIINGQLVPVTIITTQNEINDDDNNLRALKIQYKYGHSDRVPGIIPAVEDGASSFLDEWINNGPFVNNPAPNDYTTFTFSTITKKFILQSDPTKLCIAHSGALGGHAFIPLVLHYWNITAGNPFCELEMALSENIDNTAIVSNIIELNIGDGFGPLLTNETDLVDLIMQVALGVDANQHEGYFKLYNATKRYVEYIYENNLS